MDSGLVLIMDRFETNSVPFEPERDMPNAFGAYLHSRDIVATDQLNPPTQSPEFTGFASQSIENRNDSEFSDTTMILPIQSRPNRTPYNRELNNLRPSNLPGLSELMPLKPVRGRNPSYMKATTIYEESIKAIRRGLSTQKVILITLPKTCP